MNVLLEVIGFNIESCRLAQDSGANRIELCDSPGEGGTTPSLGFIRQARKLLQIPLYPMIRPRGGDFLYSADEFSIMKADILICKENGCDGIVSGILQSDGTVDIHRMEIICELAYPLGVTFHRAFDRVADPLNALENIIACGCERILTSGLKHSADNGIRLIKQLIEQSDDRIIIMPGAGIRSDNVATIAETTGATEFHTSARKMQSGDMLYRNAAFSDSMESVTVDSDEIKKIIAVLDSLSN